MQDPNAPPLNPLPPVVWLLVAPIVLIELAFMAGGNGVLGGPGAVGWRLAAAQDYGFLGDVQAQMLALGVYPPEHLMRYITYPFVHGSFTHALFVVVFILAIGKMVGEIFRPWAVLAVFFASSTLGAALYGLLLREGHLLIGGYPGVYGLIGAYTFLLWVSAGVRGESQAQAFTLIAFLLGLQLFFSLIFETGNDWLADLMGFATGFALSFVVSPGGWTRLRARLQKR